MSYASYEKEQQDQEEYERLKRQQQQLLFREQQGREVITAEIAVQYHDQSTTTSFNKSVKFSVPPGAGAGQKEVEIIKIFLFQYVLPRDYPHFTAFEFSAQLSNRVLILLDGGRELYETYLNSSEYYMDTAKLCKLVE